jgi:hypothetical protein
MGMNIWEFIQAGLEAEYENGTIRIRRRRR